jgi:hypothetical protein
MRGLLLRNTFGKMLIAGCILALGVSAAPSARASDMGFRGVGVRMGFSVDPDQIFGGVHVDLGEIVPRLRFQPNIEVGFGDDITTFSANLEVEYLFPEYYGWVFYAGGGPGVSFYNFDETKRRNDSDETDVGLVVLAGSETSFGSRDMTFFAEVKGGIGEIPDLRITVGLTF